MNEGTQIGNEEMEIIWATPHSHKPWVEQRFNMDNKPIHPGVQILQ